MANRVSIRKAKKQPRRFLTTRGIDICLPFISIHCPIEKIMTTSGLTSTTAPGKVFTSRAELAEHYKSDWHKYNLKRREAGLPLLQYSEFQARWEAALALRNEKQKAASIGKKDHLKNKNKKPKNKNKNKNNSTNNNDDNVDHTTEEESISTSASASNTVKIHPKETMESQENPEINPYQCLFDSKVSTSLQDNLLYMQFE